MQLFISTVFIAFFLLTLSSHALAAALVGSPSASSLVPTTIEVVTLVPYPGDPLATTSDLPPTITPSPDASTAVLDPSDTTTSPQAGLTDLLKVTSAISDGSVDLNDPPPTTTLPQDDVAVPPDQSSNTTPPSQNPTSPSENPTSSSNNPITSSDNPTSSSDKPTSPSDKPTSPPSNTTPPSQTPTSSSDNPTSPSPHQSINTTPPSPKPPLLDSAAINCTGVDPFCYKGLLDKSINMAGEHVSDCAASHDQPLFCLNQVCIFNQGTLRDLEVEKALNLMGVLKGVGCRGCGSVRLKYPQNNDTVDTYPGAGFMRIDYYEKNKEKKCDGYCKPKC